MKKLLLTLGLALSMTGVGSAAGLCTDVANVGQNVLSVGSCSIGHLVFSNFQVTNTGFTNVNVLLGSNSGQSGSTFDISFTVNTNPPLAGASGADIILNYTVTGAGQMGAGVRFGTGANVIIIENVCDSPFAGTTCTGTTIGSGIANVNPPPGSISAQFGLTGGPYSVTYVQKDIAFGNGGAISDFVNSHEAVPEPTTSLLMGTALLGLALLRKRFGQK